MSNLKSQNEFFRAREKKKRPNIDAIIADADAEKKESEARRKLALKIIDIGFKALLKKLHPDKGGTTEETVRLNAVRDRLNACAQQTGMPS